jgi:hypothetical protein
VTLLLGAALSLSMWSLQPWQGCCHQRLLHRVVLIQHSQLSQLQLLLLAHECLQQLLLLLLVCCQRAAQQWTVHVNPLLPLHHLVDPAGV